MCVKFHVELSVVREDYPQSLVCVNRANFEISTKGILLEGAMIRRDLKAVRTANLHKSLIACLAGDGVLQLGCEFEGVSLSEEVRIEENFASSHGCDLPNCGNVHVT